MQKIVCVIVCVILLSFCTIYTSDTNEESVDCDSSSTITEIAIDDIEESQVLNNTDQESNQDSSTISESEVTSSHAATSSVTSEENTIQECATPDNKGAFKSYTNYNLLSKDSPQWNKIQCDENAYTDKNGLRKVGEYYCVAMGSYYTQSLGDLFEIQTEGGSFKVIICDFKADKDTDINNQYTLFNNCMVEFYVDMQTLNATAEVMGDISYIDDNFNGAIIKVNKIGNYFDAKEGDNNEGKN